MQSLSHLGDYPILTTAWLHPRVFYSAIIICITKRLNDSDTALDDADLHGVALAAIQGLNHKLEERMKEKDARIERLEQPNAALGQAVTQLKQAFETLGSSRGK